MANASARLRAEVAHLRSCRRNTLSFTRIDSRGRNRFELPPCSDDYLENRRLGVAMALEVIDALRADWRGNSLGFLVYKLEPLWKNAVMRSAFFEVLEWAIIGGPSRDALEITERERMRQTFGHASSARGVTA